MQTGIHEIIEIVQQDFKDRFQKSLICMIPFSRCCKQTNYHQCVSPTKSLFITPDLLKGQVRSKNKLSSNERA